MNKPWPFDQAENVAAITTKQVLEQGFPVLRVVHYSDDHSWAFTCGTTDDPKDAKVVGMGQIVAMDDTLREIADLPVGWGASRKKVGGPWQRRKDSEL
ncbi:MAG TPA: hypothetical protein VFU31_17140 [Candidatus Binatia bacterium]|nr:hypothetical protein [Candidatus Binatia bacterium]